MDGSVSHVSSKGSAGLPRRHLAALALLALVASGGVTREVRARFLLQAVLEGVAEDKRTLTYQVLAGRVSETVLDINAHGPRGSSWPWVMRSSAAALIHGGACGDAALAMGGALDQLNLPFRILMVNVQGWGATHVMVEAQDEGGRWLLVDPLGGFLVRHPTTGAPLTLDETRSLPQELAAQLPERLRPGREWTLFARNERTIWNNFGPVGRAIEAMLPADVRETFCLRAFLIEPGYEVASLCALIAVAMLLARRLGGPMRALQALTGSNPFRSRPKRIS